MTDYVLGCLLLIDNSDVVQHVQPTAALKASVQGFEVLGCVPSVPRASQPPLPRWLCALLSLGLPPCTAGWLLVTARSIARVRGWCKTGMPVVAGARRPLSQYPAAIK